MQYVLFPGWNSKANIIYIDQPGGTGFSYVDKPVSKTSFDTCFTCFHRPSMSTMRLNLLLISGT